MNLNLPEGYSTRPPLRDDAAAIAALISAAQADYGDDEPVSAEQVLGDWDGVDIAANALLVSTTGGEVVGLADIDDRGDTLIGVYGFVHPTHQGRGLGTALVHWSEDWVRVRQERAPQPAPVIVQQYIPGPNTAGRQLLESLGYRSERTIFRMSITLDQAPPAPEPPDGIDLRDFVVNQDERAMFDVMEDAFRDNWGGTEGDYERWLQTSQAERSDAGLWHLALERGSGAVVGGCQGSAAGGTGWIRGLGVLPACRRRGLGQALLLRSFAAFFERGVCEIGLSVDAESATGAPRLYTRAGMRVTQSYHVYRKALLPEGGARRN